MPRANSTSYLISVEGIPVEVTRKAVRNVNLRVCDDGSVRMSVPWRVSRDQAMSLATQRADWIRRMRERVLERTRSESHLWRSGETLDVWGVPRGIEVRTGSPRSARLLGEELVITVEPRLAGDDEPSVRARGALVEDLLARLGREAVAEVLPRLEARVGREAASVTLRRMRTRWGSCTTSKGTIRINTALVEHPRECLEMVLTHELCHLIEPNHGPRFKAQMDRCCPGWRELQRHLDENPPRTKP